MTEPPDDGIAGGRDHLPDAADDDDGLPPGVRSRLRHRSGGIRVPSDAVPRRLMDEPVVAPTPEGASLAASISFGSFGSFGSAGDPGQAVPQAGLDVATQRVAMPALAATGAGPHLDDVVPDGRTRVMPAIQLEELGLDDAAAAPSDPPYPAEDAPDTIVVDTELLGLVPGRPPAPAPVADAGAAAAARISAPVRTVDDEWSDGTSSSAQASAPPEMPVVQFGPPSGPVAAAVEPPPATPAAAPTSGRMQTAPGWPVASGSGGHAETAAFSARIRVEAAAPAPSSLPSRSGEIEAVRIPVEPEAVRIPIEPPPAVDGPDGIDVDLGDDDVPVDVEDEAPAEPPVVGNVVVAGPQPVASGGEPAAAGAQPAGESTAGATQSAETKPGEAQAGATQSAETKPGEAQASGPEDGEAEALADDDLEDAAAAAGDGSDSGEILADELLEEVEQQAASASQAPVAAPQAGTATAAGEAAEPERPPRPAPPPAQLSAVPSPMVGSAESAPTAVAAKPPPAPTRPPPAPPVRRNSGRVAAVAAEAAPAGEAREAATNGKRRRLRPWFEEIFDEDYLRTLPFLTPRVAQVEAQFVAEAMALQPGAELLDVGCGYGRHAMELAARGYRVVASDLSGAMLARGQEEAQRRGLDIAFQQRDMRELDHDARFDGAYCLFSTFGYFDDEDNKRTLANIARSLKPGGRFVLDILNRDYLVAELPTRVWWEGEGCVVLEEVEFNYISSRVQVNRSVVFDDGRQLEQEISVRAYSLHELGKLMLAAGFRVTEISGSFATRSRFFGSTSKQLIVVAERKARDA
jgi:SAM-dependent methyltransferase